MRLDHMALPWKKIVSGLAVLFIFWSIWLVVSTQSLQRQAADITRLGDALLSLDSWLRTWDDHLLDSPAAADSLFKRWTPLRRHLQNKNEIFLQAGTKRALYQKSISRTDSTILKVYFRALEERDRIVGGNPVPVIATASRSDIYTLLLEIRVLEKLLRHQLNQTLIKISHKWKQLNVLVLISTCLVLFAAILLVFYSRNITRLEKLRESLSYKTSVLECLANAADDGILVVLNEDEVFTYNHKLLKLWHLSEREMQYSDAKTILGILASKLTQPDKFHAEVRHLYEHKFEKSQNVLMLLEDKIFESFSAPVLSERGIYYGRVWYFRDVTSHTQAKQALQRSEQHFRSLVRNASDIISIHDVHGRMRFENPALSKILGYPSGTLTGKNIFKYVHQADVRRIQQQLRDMINRPGTEKTLNLRFRHQNGGWRILEAISKAIKNHTGDTTILVTSRDKTERMRIQNLQNIQFAITRIISTARSIENAVPDLLKEIGRKLHCAYGEIWLNGGDDNRLKFRQNWQSGKNAFRVQRERLIQDQQYFREALLQPASTKAKVIRFSAILQDSDWQRCLAFDYENYAEALIFPILIGRQIIGLAFFLSKNEIEISHPLPQLMLDIGSQIGQFLERIEAEKALSQERALLSRRVKERTADLLIANKELAFAAKSKDEFLANMSHEFRTPLNIIIGLCEALSEDLFGDLSGEQKEAISNIDESGRHLLTLINDILDLSRIESGKFQLDIAPTSIESVVETSIRIVSEMAMQKRIAIENEFDPQLLIVEADARRLKQILVNLLSNAIKFTDEGGAIGLDISGGQTASAVHFTVWDKGVGIEARNLKRLFNPFVQLDAGLSRTHSGTGMGLVLVKRLVELHGGGVSLQSEPGKGSRFTVSLPWRNPASIHTSDDDAETDTLLSKQKKQLAGVFAGREKTVLIVENNKISIELYKRYLNNLNLRSEFLRSAHELPAITGKKRPSLILIDLAPDEKNTLDMVRKLCSLNTLQHTAIFASAALSLPGDRRRCLQAGFHAYFQKPVAEHDFYTALTQLFTKQVKA